MKTLSNLADKNELLRRLDGVTVESPRRWGRMSVQQMICHLCDGYRMYLGEKTVAPVRVAMPRVVLRWVALWAPLQWPRGFQTAPELDQQTGGTKPALFASDKQQLVELIEHCASVPADFAWPLHPHFGKMTTADWMRLGYLHCDHHLRQFGA